MLGMPEGYGRHTMTDEEVELLKAYEGSLEQITCLAPAMLKVLKAMSEAPYDQPVGVWQYAINYVIAAAEGKEQ